MKCSFVIENLSLKCMVHYLYRIVIITTVILCYGTTFGIEGLKTKQIMSFIESMMKIQGCQCNFYAEIKYENWSDNITITI